MNEDSELSKQLMAMIHKSKESMKVAKNLHKQGYYNDAASKSYYAVFHALQAILLTKNMSFSKHTAVLSAFNKEFIYPNIFPKDFYKKIMRLFKDRQIGDYEYDKVIEEEGSLEDVDDAEMIINAVIEYLKIK